MTSSPLALLKTRRFLPLFLVQFLGAFSDNVFKNALVILIAYRAATETGIDSGLLVTAAAGLFILPFLLFSAVAGQIADAFGKARLIRIVKAAEIPVMALAAAGFLLGHWGVLLFVLFLAGTQSAFFGPLKYGILPETLGAKEILGGNALVEAGTFLAILGGTILGGLLILNDGGPAAVSALLLAAALLGWLAALFVPGTPEPAQKPAITANILRGTLSLVRQARREDGVFPVILAISWFWLTGFTFLAQLPLYAQGALGADEGAVTLFLTVFSVGVALGSLLCARLLKGRVSAAHVPAGALGMAAGIFLLCAATATLEPAQGPLSTLPRLLADPARWPALLGVLTGLLALSVAGGVYIVPLYALMQTRCDPAHRARTVAVNNVMNALFMVLGAVAAMLLLKLGLDAAGIFLILGLANIPAALLARRAITT